MPTADEKKEAGAVRIVGNSEVREEENGGLRFHYNREERLKKLRSVRESRKPRFLANRRIRSLIIIFIDLALIALVLYFLNKPANLYMKKSLGSELYELNITGMRGGKVLIGFTLKNQTEEQMKFTQAVPVVVEIKGKNDQELTFQKSIEKDTVLNPHESTSIIFLEDEQKLPVSGRVEVFFKTKDAPVFSKNVRF